MAITKVRRKILQGLSSLFVTLFSVSSIYAQVNKSDLPPNNLPIELDAGIYLYKVYDINTVEETFNIDGYFTYTWKDDRMAFDTVEMHTNQIAYFNDRFDDVIKTDLWFPEMEFINTLGQRVIDNKACVVRYDGKITYLERFHATLKQELKYRKFPFDKQELKIEIEPFLYTAETVKFNSLQFQPASGLSKINSVGWDILKTDTNVHHIASTEYTDRENGGQVTHHQTKKINHKYAHIEAILYVKRNPGFYIWQLIFPLMIILLASIVVLWIDDFGTQIGVAFTLMLTIVAFNFFSETLLPKLPYNTFIEVLIMVGYVLMLFCIFVVVYLNHVHQSHGGRSLKIIRLARIYYPIILVMTVVLSSLLYFVL